jgi:hypothetical protein
MVVNVSMNQSKSAKAKRANVVLADMRLQFSQMFTILTLAL